MMATEEPEEDGWWRRNWEFVDSCRVEVQRNISIVCIV